MEPTFQTQIAKRGDSVVLVVIGEVDIATAPLLEQRLTEAESIDAATVIVDLDGVSFMDSSGLQVLLSHVVSETNGRRVRLTRGSRQVQRLFEVSGMRDHLPFVS
jgi:anti-sigma B factor antagonist